MVGRVCRSGGSHDENYTKNASGKKVMSAAEYSAASRSARQSPSGGT